MSTTINLDDDAHADNFLINHLTEKFRGRLANAKEELILKVMHMYTDNLFTVLKDWQLFVRVWMGEYLYYKNKCIGTITLETDLKSDDRKLTYVFTPIKDKN